MSQFNVNRFGQANGTGATDALFLKLFGGEVFMSYQATTVFEPLTRMKTIPFGKSASFPKHGKLTNGGYHVPGQMIQGEGVLTNEVIVNVDGLYISHATIADVDDAMSHYDARGPYSTRIGQELAQWKDKRNASALIQAARTTTPTIAGDNAGETIAVANLNTDAAVLDAAIALAAQKFDEKNVAADSRYVALRPAQWYLLLRGVSASTSGGYTQARYINRDWNGYGSLNTATLPELYGVTPVKTNNLPSGVRAAGTQDKNTYAGDYSKTFGVAFHTDAISTVRLIGVQTQMERSVSRQGTLMVGRVLEGVAPTCPECAIELATP